MRIVSLTENTTKRGDLQAEHGLSLYIETQGQTLLFDMGQTDAFARNAQTLGIDLNAVDLAVISHGHYDHGGGLETFLSINRHAPVYVHQEAFLPHWNGIEKYIGLDPALQNHPRLIFTQDTCAIAPHLTLFTCNQQPKHLPVDHAGLNQTVDGRQVPDTFQHEQYLLIEENGKRVLISGCSHKGILNIVQWFTPHVLVGGFHFSKRPLNQSLSATARQLAAFSTDFYTCHCTGVEQYEWMKQHMPRLHYLSCGDGCDL